MKRRSFDYKFPPQRQFSKIIPIFIDEYMIGAIEYIPANWQLKPIVSSHYLCSDGSKHEYLSDAEQHEIRSYLLVNALGF